MRRFLLGAAGVLLLAACDNAGSGRTLGITAAGVVRGEVFFDANGSGLRDAEDTPFAGALVRVLGPSSADTLFRATTGADGTFVLSGVPVGAYVIVIDSASAGADAIVSTSAQSVRVAPDDTVEIASAISYRTVSADEARTLTAGTRVFVTGIALHARSAFGDTTLHVTDTSGALRATRVRPSAVSVSAGDSVRLRGRIGARAGQAVLDEVTVFTIGPTLIPLSPVLPTATAATAAGGTRDAELVRLFDATILDTATVAGNLTLTVSDGSGPVIVVLDRISDIAFRTPSSLAEFVPPNRFDITGVLVPTGPGTWHVRPRTTLDLVRR